MKNHLTHSLLLVMIVAFSACTENLDPLSPGSTDGQYALGIKALVPLAVGNSWTYGVTLYDTAGAERKQYSYTLSVKDTITADTSRIPLVPPRTNRLSLSRLALVWYLIEGESGITSCWQIDSLENLRIRKSDDARFYEQSAFNFRSFLGDVTPARYIGKDTITWASGDRFIYNADSVRSTLISKGIDTLRTTLGSAPYFMYREFYTGRTDYIHYTFKPGFGLLLKEYYQRTSGGRTVRVRCDKLSSYHFR